MQIAQVMRDEFEGAGRRISRAACDFLLAPASPRPIAALRIGLASVLLIQALLVSPDLLQFYASDGLVQESLAPFFTEPLTPQISHVVDALAPLGISEAATIVGLGFVYVASLVALGLGWRTRLAAIAAWFLHWMFMASGSTSNYGVEIYAHVFLFYLIFMPAGNALSIDVAVGDKLEQATPYARLCLRVLQIQLCIAYLSSGLEKAVGIGWWNGEALWNSLMLPDYNQYDFGWLANYPAVPMILGWGTLLLETGYAFFIWPKATRKWWILAMVGLHLGISIFLGLTLFGMIMCVLTMTVFGVSPEPVTEVVLEAEPERRRVGMVPMAVPTS